MADPLNGRKTDDALGDALVEGQGNRMGVLCLFCFELVFGFLVVTV